MREIVCVAVVLLVSAGVLMAAPPGRAEDPSLVLIVGTQDEMKSRNPLPAVAGDIFTRDVLDRVYGTVLLRAPSTSQPLAYIAKGVDFDEDGRFEPSEYNVWGKVPGSSTPLTIDVYYDFNGVRWHDGTQLDLWDLLFSYHLNAMHGVFNASLRVLFAAGANASYEAGNRQLTIEIAAKNWDNEALMPGNPSLRTALRFNLMDGFARFYERTLAPTLFPLHVWSGMGGGRHGDFGCAIYLPPSVATARGVPCGTADPDLHGKGVPSGDPVGAFDYTTAVAWSPADGDVIGSGAFRFDKWVPGVEAKVVRNEDFYTGVSGTTVYDGRLASILKRPTIEGIRYKVYKTTQIGVFALQSREIDFYHWNVGPEFVPDLLKIPEIAVESNAEPGYFYVGYNLREAPWGYDPINPANDVGYWLRQAISHLVDKRSIVQNHLQNWAVIMHGFISPANTFWYNDNIPKPAFDLTAAIAILDDPARGGAAGIGSDPPGACHKDNDAGCRSLPVIGNVEFEILNPYADYGYPGNPYSMIADAMRQVGLNAVSRPTAFGEIVNRITAHNFDLYFLGWRIADWDPDYLYEFYHSSNAPTGLKYVGFNNATFDLLIEASRRELNSDVRRSFIFQAHDILVDARPAEPLFSRTNIEGYRQDRFINWTVLGGTIWNDWSLLGLRPAIPLGERLHVQVTAPSAMFAGASDGIVASVFDSRGLVVPGARVTLSVDSGTLTVGSTSGSWLQSTTNANGQVSGTFTAPSASSATSVLIEVSATHRDFHDSFLFTDVVTVFPLGERFLSLRIELPFGDIVRQGSILPVAIEVRDQDGTLVPDAVVDVTSTNESLLRPSRANGTAAELAGILVEAMGPLEDGATAVLTVVASMSGYHDAEANVGIFVLPEAHTYRCATGEIVRDLADCPPAAPQLDASFVVMAVAAVVVATAGAAFVVVRRRR